MAKTIFRANAKFERSGTNDITGTAECQMFVVQPGGIIKANFGTGLVGIPVGEKVLGTIVNGVLKGLDGNDGIPLLAKNVDVQVTGVLNYQCVIKIPKFDTRLIATFPAPIDTTPVDLMGYIDATGVRSAGLTELPIDRLTDLPPFARDLLRDSSDAAAARSKLLTLSETSINTLLSSRATLTGTETLVQKRIPPRIAAITSSATPAINTDTVDTFNITALSTPITSMTSNLSGTPGDGERLQIRFKDNGTPQAITWGSKFVGTLLSTTVANKTHVQELVYDIDIAKWAGVLADTNGY